MKIPEKFYNSLSEEPFTHCKMCQAELLESAKSYLIEKAYRRFPDNGAEQLIFEVAICMQCATGMRSSLSADSVDTVNQYFYERSMERREELLELSPDDLLKTCLFSGAPLENMEEYQVYAHCRGRELAPMGGMYLLSGAVIEEIQQLLSPETKDELDNFSDNHLGTPPELQQLFSRGHLLSM